MFSTLSKKTLARAAILKDVPVYVQYYITARCNLTCQQCNIIYANSDVREVTLDEVKKVADNLAELGVAIVLLTGGEPFMRKDLPEIIYAFESRGVHVRMQTNGLATEDQIAKAVEAGGCDISISLDTLRSDSQDHINGDFSKSWHKAIKAMSLFMQYLPKKDSFASLGCVLQRDNIGDIEDVIRFGTEIGWFTSLVPVHVTNYSRPRGFQTFDQSQRFLEKDYPVVANVIERVRDMRQEGYLLYDSDQYLDDIKRFIKNEPIEWRRKNKGVCDSPNLYFALLPNAEIAPCCDHRLSNSYPAYADEFVENYKSTKLRREMLAVTEACDGCMYGSYPEMTISMRFLAAKIQRVQTFFTKPPEKNWPISYDDLLTIAEGIRNELRDRPVLDGNNLLKVKVANG